MIQQTNHKLGVIVPYRHRYEHLITFKYRLSKHLNSNGIKFELIVVEQDDAKTFNRGKLLNIGFKVAKQLKCDYVAFHDVDMIPIDADYSYTDVPVHLATNFTSNNKIKRVTFDEYFGGVTLFPVHTFDEINGYSNDYWGWGYEDNDLLYRCKINRVDLDKKEIKMEGGNTAALNFNGSTSYVRARNVIDTSIPLTLFVSFYPNEILCNHEKYDDTYSIFTIPGLDFLISYNSYGKYNFEIYDSKDEIIYINSEIKPNYKTNICVTIDPKRKVIKMYQDGVIVGSKTYTDELYDYSTERYMYLGVGNPKNKVNPKFFNGCISNFAYFSSVLKEEEVMEISMNQFFGLTQNFGKYESADSIKLYYDVKFIKGYKLIDLGLGNNNGNIIKCEIVGFAHDQIKILQIPFRRLSTFLLLQHEENGYVGNGWRDSTTRYNQLKFYNEVSKGYRNPKEDGLSTCEYKEHSRSTVDNETHLLVGI